MTFLFLLIVLVGVPFFLFRKKGAGLLSGSLDFRVTRYAKGLLMLGVIMHHLSQRCSPDTCAPWEIIVNLFQGSGAFLCSAFFFFSGYGLVHSLMVKEGYLGTIPRRMASILIPYLIANVIYGSVYFLSWEPLEGESLIGRIAACLTNIVYEEAHGSTLVKYAWFIDQILLLYLFFHISNKYLSPLKALFAQLILCMGFIMLIRHLGWGGWRYNSMLAFIFGQLYRYCLVVPSLKRRCAYFILPVLALAACLYVAKACLGMNVPFMGVLACPLCILPGIVILSFLEARPCKLADLLSSASFDIYMYQGICFLLSSYLCLETPSYCLCVLISSLVVGYLAHLMGYRASAFILNVPPISSWIGKGRV